MSEPMVEVDSLAIRYGGLRVLDDVSFELGDGQVLALVGRNGVGKSSLVRCLLGQQKPRDGRVRVFGLDPWRRRALVMRRVGAVLDVPDAPPRRSVRAIGRLVGRLEPRWDAAFFDSRLERFGVPADALFGSLSRGQATQSMLSLALAARPDLLILDDPTLGLDVLARREVVGELIDELAERGTPMLVASHDFVGLERLATHVALLDRRGVTLHESLDALKEELRWVSVAPLEALPALEALEPLASRSMGATGGREVLVRRLDPRVIAALEERFGSGSVDVSYASLEDLALAVFSGSAASNTEPSDSDSTSPNVHTTGSARDDR